MSAGSFLLLAAGMALVTYLPRWLPLALLSGRRLPGWLAQWLDLLPAAILAALVAPALFAAEGRHVEFGRPEALAALPTLLVALLTRSLAATVVAGMAVYWLLQRFG